VSNLAQRLAALCLEACLIPWSFCACVRRETPLTGSSQRSPEVQEALARAEEAYQRGYPLRTEEFLRRAYRGAPDDPDIALDLGDTLNRLTRNQAALEHYREFLSRHPSARAVRLSLALTLIPLGRWDDAVVELERCVAEQPRESVAQLRLGSVLSRLGKSDAALPHLRAAVELAPGDSSALAALGVAYRHLGRIPEASAAFEKAVVLDPANVGALFNLGNCYARMGRETEAQETLERFVRASSGKERYIDEKRLFRAAQARAYELSEAGKEEKALEALLAYREQLKDFPPFQQELGVAYLRLGRRGEALLAFERAVSLDPALAEAHAHLMVLYQQDGQRDKAMRERAFVDRPVPSPPPPSDR